LRAAACGAVAFFVYANAVSWLMMRYRLRALVLTTTLIPLWFGIALAGWLVFIR